MESMTYIGRGELAATGFDNESIIELIEKHKLYRVDQPSHEPEYLLSNSVEWPRLETFIPPVKHFLPKCYLYSKYPEWLRRRLEAYGVLTKENFTVRNGEPVYSYYGDLPTSDPEEQS